MYDAEGRSGSPRSHDHLERLVLQVQRCPASSRPEIEDGAATDERQEFPLLPVPLLEAAEEPLWMQRWPGLAALLL
jgi:hypothetical protein